jgi:outer membrane protein assembly factor BamB
LTRTEAARNYRATLARFVPQDIRTARSYFFASDGKLYRLDTSTGKDMHPPVSVAPAGADASNLNTAEGVIYTTTRMGCGGAPNAVWEVDLSGEQPKVTSFTLPDSLIGRDGAALGNDGEVYLQTSNSLQALSKDLKPQQVFSAALGEPSPIVFAHNERDVVVAAGKDGSLYLLDSKALNSPLFRTAPIAAVAGLSTWETPEGDHWV